MNSYAQTNIQLFNQMQDAGYEPADLARVRDAYALAMVLFTGCFRQSGKTFIAHLVGTASILVELRSSAATVAAGLLHAAYSHGEFGTGSRAFSEGKRKQLRLILGTEAESLVAEYTTSSWNEQIISGLQSSLPLAGSVAHEVLLIRLANELEDHLDLAALYSGSVECRRNTIKSYLGQCVDIAEGLGFPDLASALSKAFAETLSGNLPAALEVENIHLTHKRAVHLIGWKSSFLLPPASHGWRLKIRLDRFVRRGMVARVARKLGLTRIIRRGIFARAARLALPH